MTTVRLFTVRYFIFFRPCSVNPADGCVGNLPVGQQFLKYSDQTIWHQQPCHVQSPFAPTVISSKHYALFIPQHFNSCMGVGVHVHDPLYKVPLLVHEKGITENG